MTKKPENNRNSIGRFVEGSSGNPNGRPVGSKNKFTTLKNAFIETFEELGGVDNLVEWARANQTEFYRMVARLMPREVEAKISSEFTLVDALMEMEKNLVAGMGFLGEECYLKTLLLYSYHTPLTSKLVL